jgi:hypothetical protein
MTDAPLIPASPSEDDYVRQVTEATPPPLLPEGDPIRLFEEWLAEAGKGEPNDPNAVALSTVDDDGLPDSRMVLLKSVDARGFVFYTNTQSAKGVELEGRPKAALLFHWKSLRRQVRVRGVVEPVTSEEADAYFASRARHLGFGPVAAAARPPGPGAAGGRDGAEVRPGQGAAPAALVGLPRRASSHRILARPPVPSARTAGLPADRRGLGDQAAVPLACDP